MLLIEYDLIYGIHNDKMDHNVVNVFKYKIFSKLLLYSIK